MRDKLQQTAGWLGEKVAELCAPQISETRTRYRVGDPIKSPISGKMVVIRRIFRLESGQLQLWTDNGEVLHPR